MSDLSSIIKLCYPIRENIFKYLKPSEISNLCVVTGTFLDDYEREKHMPPIYEVFTSTESIINENIDYIAFIGDDAKNMTRYSANININIIAYKSNYEDIVDTGTGVEEYIQRLCFLFRKDVIHGNIEIISERYTRTQYLYKDNNLRVPVSAVGERSQMPNPYDKFKSLGHEVDNVIKLWRQNNYEDREYTCSCNCYIMYQNTHSYYTLQLRLISDTIDADEGTYHFLRIKDINPSICITSLLTSRPLKIDLS